MGQLQMELSDHTEDIKTVSIIKASYISKLIMIVDALHSTLQPSQILRLEKSSLHWQTLPTEKGKVGTLKQYRWITACIL